MFVDSWIFRIGKILYYWWRLSFIAEILLYSEM